MQRRDANVKAAIRAVVAAFRSAGCAACGERDDCCLEAHHRDPSQKDFSISNAIHQRRSAVAVKRELKKCCCLCCNCHRKVHAGRIQLPER